MISVYIVDLHGRILAPIDQMNSLMNASVVKESLKSGTEKELITEEGTLIISHPLQFEGQIKGSAVILYRLRNTSGNFGNSIVSSIGVLCFVVFMSIASGFLISRILIFPWFRLRMAMEEAVNNQKTSVDIPITFPEIEMYKVQIERLLLRGVEKSEHTDGESQSTERERVGELLQPESENNLSADIELGEFGENEIAIYINRNSNMVSRCSQGFYHIFGQLEERSRHVLDVFNDPEVFRKLNKLLCESVNETTVTIRERNYSVSMKSDEGKVNFVKVSFTEL